MGQDDRRDALFTLKETSNFETWRMALFARAMSKGILAGLLNPATEYYQKHPRYSTVPESEWLEADEKMRGIILGHIDPMLQRLLTTEMPAWYMLQELQQQIAGGAESNRQALLAEMSSFKAKRNEGVRQYTHRALTLQDKLRLAGCGQDTADNMRLQFFQGLPEHLLDRGFTIQMHGLSIERAMLELLRIETQMQSRGVNPPAAVGAVERGRGGDRSKRDSRRGERAPRQAGGPTCYNCGEQGHISYDCPKPRNTGAKKKFVGAATGSALAVRPSASGGRIILDSGSEVGHICHDISLFDPASLYEVDVTLFFGPTKYKITQAGLATIQTNGDAELGLKDALYCPDMAFTIVSKDRLLGIEALVVRDSHERNSPCA